MLRDEPNRVANILKHGFDFSDLTESFFLSAAVFARLESEGISIISLRRANKNERSLLE
jgi:uncharacterized protein